MRIVSIVRLMTFSAILAAGPTYAAETSLLVHRQYVRLPVSQSVAEQTVTFSIGDQQVHSITARVIDPAATAADEFVEVDVSAWLGANLTVAIADADQRALSGLRETNAAIHTTAEQNASPASATDAGQPVATQPISFAHQVQPILSDNCFSCHGRGETHEHTELRLSSREAAIEHGALAPGDVDASTLVARIATDDESLVMPPPYSHKKPLTEEQIAVLKQWIAEGARYEKHWSFAPIETAAAPLEESTEAFPIRQPIDAFVLRKLRAAGLEPNAQQEPRRLIRRLAFDLTGLPPATDVLERFTATPTDELYQQVVDEMLASPQYGEHWARHWLDAVRYGDTHGIHVDSYRSIWPYRDWVIRAFNRNMPFDEFTIEQLAGDMLPNASQEQLIATGYNRCLPTTSEGGSIEEEVAVNNANDQTATTFGVWQGLTVACASCHDHKYDPLAKKEYYQLTAYFRNNTMAALDGNIRLPAPYIEAPSDDQRRQREELRAERERLLAQIAAIEAVWQSTLAQTSVDQQLADLREVTQQENATAVALEPLATLTPSVEQMPAAPVVEGLFGPLPQLSDNHVVGFDIGFAPDVDRGFAFGGFVNLDENTHGVLWSQKQSDNGDRGWEVVVHGDGRMTIRLIDVPIRRSVQYEFPATEPKLGGSGWRHLVVSYDPADRVRPLTLLVDGKSISYAVPASSAERLPARSTIASDARVVLGGSDRKNGEPHPGLRGGAALVSQFRVYDRPIAASEALAMQLEGVIAAAGDRPAAELGDKHRGLVTENYKRLRAPKLYEHQRRLADVDAALAKLDQEIPRTLVTRERPGTPKAHDLDRGEYAQKLEEVTAGLPAMLPQPPETTPRNRLGLAVWLTSPKNPLTARVTVNRYWHYLFGRGIVETTEDLGATGSRPSHPELLDWLASDWLAHDWDLHHLLRTIVTSSTYRQSQRATPTKLEADPENRLLSRGPRTPLDGEQLRDAALANAGLLVDKLGGPPVYPYQPPRIWEDVSMSQSNARFYHRGAGDDLYRRSIYTVWKRSAAPPSMTILGAPDRDVFCTRRERTNSPLQAFVLWNDPQFVEAARKLAERVMNAKNDFQSRANRVGQLVLSRDFASDELDALRAVLRDAKQRFDAEPQKAEALLSVGDASIATDLPRSELAAWTTVVSTVMNLDEAVMK